MSLNNFSAPFHSRPCKNCSFILNLNTLIGGRKMKRITLLALVCLTTSALVAADRQVTEREALVFLQELLSSAHADKVAVGSGHPFLQASLWEASHSGRLTFTMTKDDDIALGTPALAAWHGEIMQDGKKAFGFRLRRSSATQGLEVYHFWTIGVPKGLKVIRGFIVHRKADPAHHRQLRGADAPLRV